ncbi:MAG: hypothetical protein V4534_08955 [Myxococcota bacterium]
MKIWFFIILTQALTAFALNQAEATYRQAEKLETRLLLPKAIVKYREVVEQKDRIWSRRAAFRMICLIRDVHFAAGRSENVRRKVVSLYKSVLADLPNSRHDPELQAALLHEIRWTRLGLTAPKMLF